MEMPVLMAMSREQLLNVWVSPLKASYDFILFDCAPTLGIILVNAFVASDSVCSSRCRPNTFRPQRAAGF